jgi:hypothetical protein
MVPFVNEQRDRASVKEVALIALICVPIFVIVKSYYDAVFNIPISDPFIALVIKLVDPFSYFLVFTFAYYLYSAFIWRWIAKAGMLDVPLIDGSWKGTVSAEHIPQPIPITMAIRQKLDKIDMESLSSGNFRSNAVLMAYDRDSAGKSRIKYLYRCIKDGRNDHYGTAVLTFHGEGHAEGWYYTDANANRAGHYSPSGIISINRA